MKKTILAISILTLFSIALVSFAQATTSTVPDIKLDIFDFLIKATNWVFGIVIAIAAIMLIWAGFTYITSGGNAEKMKTALNSVIYALIGVAIAVLAKGLIYMICMFVGGTVTECTFF
jgi:hypothetical protein